MKKKKKRDVTTAAAVFSSSCLCCYDHHEHDVVERGGVLAREEAHDISGRDKRRNQYKCISSKKDRTHSRTTKGSNEIRRMCTNCMRCSVFAFPS